MFYLRYSYHSTEYSYTFQSTMNHHQGTSIKLCCIKLKLLCVSLSVLAAMEIMYIKHPFHIMYTTILYRCVYIFFCLTLLQYTYDNFPMKHPRCVFRYLKKYIIWQSNTTFYCIKYISKWYFNDNDNYMFRLSSVRHLQVVTLGYFNVQLTLLLSARSQLHRF